MPAPNLVWLASYPKSGNTWTRVFLANYILDRDTPVPLGEIHRIGANDSGVDLYKRIAGPGFLPTDLSAALTTRTRLLKALSENGASVNFLKTHNLNAPVGMAQLVPPALTKAAVYILRDPRDVAVSYARHFGVSHAKAVANFADANHSTAPSQQAVKQYLGTWSAHVAGWVDGAAFPVFVQRYEDMLAAPEEVFASMLEFIGIPVEPKRLSKAVRFSDFGELSRQEAETGFSERSANSDRFFHTGTANQWRTALSEEEARRLVEDHGAVMRGQGYL